MAQLKDTTITGNLSVSGTVDGRDIAADGEKLDGIEEGAEVNQSDSEIKTQYENNANTNAFTDSEKTKVANAVQGQASSTVGYVAVANDTSGKSVKYVPVEVDDSGNVVISGNATINGTLTTVNSETLQVKDKNIEIAKVDTPTDDTADGGGITLLGATNKTITWVKSKLAWVFNQAVEIAGNLNVIGTIKTNGTQISTSDLSDGADLVKGPASSTDNTLPRFDLTTGKLLQAGGSITNLDNGNVGIGTNNPTEKLHVIGNIAVSGKVDGRDVSVDGAKLDKISGYVTSNFAGKIAKTLDVNTLNAEVTLFTVPSGTMCKCGNMADSTCKLYIFGIKTGMSDDAVVDITFKNFAGTARTRTFTLNTLGGDPYVFVCNLVDQKIGAGDVKVKVTTAGTSTNGDVIITTDAVW